MSKHLGTFTLPSRDTARTPAPWVEADDGWVRTPDGRFVLQYAGCGSHGAEWRSPADKRLALAAPVMLAALVSMRKAALDMLASDGPDGDNGKAARALLDAIALATGEVT